MGCRECWVKSIPLKGKPDINVFVRALRTQKVLGRLRQKDHKFKASLSNIVRQCPKMNSKRGRGLVKWLSE